MSEPRHVFAALLAAVLWPADLAGAVDLSGAARPVDGDTIEIAGQRVRLHGIDAPETAQPCFDRNGTEWRCGIEAAAALARLIEGEPVHCAGDEYDAYGRLIAVCRTESGELNSRMVRDGMAVAFTRYSDDYLEDGIDAEISARGIWGGSFERPEDYRARKRRGDASDCPPDRPVKGNVSEAGRVYHVPWSPHYDRTRIDAARGERCFGTEAEALAAGWRAPRS